MGATTRGVGVVTAVSLGAASGVPAHYEAKAMVTIVVPLGEAQLPDPDHGHEESKAYRHLEVTRHLTATSTGDLYGVTLSSVPGDRAETLCYWVSGTRNWGRISMVPKLDLEVRSILPVR